MNKSVNNKAMLNAYPDSMGGTLNNIIEVLNKKEFKDVFRSFYILPSIFNTDLDRGFSVIDYGINKVYANENDFKELGDMNIDFKFDFILNHLSVLSPQFQDIIKNGENSEYKDFFINWNKFWEGTGTIGEDGVLEPEEKYIKDMFFRKPSLPVLNVRYPDGREVPYWNTFYQEVKYKMVNEIELVAHLGMQYQEAKLLVERINQVKSPKEIDFTGFEEVKEAVVNYLEDHRQYLGQMDVNIKSPLVMDFYKDTIRKLANYGAKIVRLDAFAYASKEVGKRNFFNLPDTWDDLYKIKEMADAHEITLLPEIHSTYEEKLHEEISERGFMTYDFFLPGLLIDAFERNTNEALLKWLDDIITKKIKTVNMLGCHDGIPLLDLKGLLSEDKIQNLINIVVGRGGYVKDLHGAKNMYYQVNATYYSALGEDEKKLELARAIQMFMPGKPQVWYLDLFAGKNDYEALKKAGVGGHKEINRTNLTQADIEESLKLDIVKNQIKLLKFRNQCEAFSFDSKVVINKTESHILDITHENNGTKARLIANLKDYNYDIMVNEKKD